jgi:hypothetical protein
VDLKKQSPSSVMRPHFVTRPPDAYCLPLPIRQFGRIINSMKSTGPIVIPEDIAAKCDASDQFEKLRPWRPTFSIRSKISRAKGRSENETTQSPTQKVILTTPIAE